MGFKKKKQQPAVYEVSTVEPAKTVPEKSPFGLKRTNSDVEESSEPVPKLK